MLFCPYECQVHCPLMPRLLFWHNKRTKKGCVQTFCTPDFASTFTCTVYPVDVDVDAGPPEHEHDRIGVLLLDLVLEDHFVWESNPALSRILPGEDAGATAHLDPLNRTKWSRSTCESWPLCLDSHAARARNSCPTESRNTGSFSLWLCLSPVKASLGI